MTQRHTERPTTWHTNRWDHLRVFIHKVPYHTERWVQLGVTDKLAYHTERCVQGGGFSGMGAVLTKTRDRTHMHREYQHRRMHEYVCT